MNTIFDVIVVGAGPAGALAARLCAQRGLKTLILDKQILPRYKACGGGITLGAINQLDFNLPEEIVEGACSTIQVRYDKYSANVSRNKHPLILTSRSKFDNFITSKAIEAGAELHERRFVKHLEVLKSHVVVQCESESYRTRLVIGADGAYSVVAKTIRPAFGRDQIGIACDVVIGNDELKFPDRSVAVFDFGSVKYGYAWIFPRKEYLGVGIGAMATKMSLPKEKLLSVLGGWGVRRTNIEAHWHILPAGGFDRKIYADRIMLVGDAAGFVDPLLGSGIELAFRSAKIASDTAEFALEVGNCQETILKEYADKCNNEFGRALRKRLHLTRIIHRYPALFVKPFAMSAILTELVLGKVKL